MNYNSIIEWLLNGDPSIQYQVNRDLLGNDKTNIQKKIAKVGWGYEFLSRQREDGHWGIAFYQPKWISTHYTILDLKNLFIAPTTKSIQKTISSVLKKEMRHDYVQKYEMIVNKDICINGMVLNYASYFNADENLLEPIVDYLINNQMKDASLGLTNSPSNRTLKSSLGQLIIATVLSSQFEHLLR